MFDFEWILAVRTPMISFDHDSGTVEWGEFGVKLNSEKVLVWPNIGKLDGWICCCCYCQIHKKKQEDFLVEERA